MKMLLIAETKTDSRPLASVCDFLKLSKIASVNLARFLAELKLVDTHTVQTYFIVCDYDIFPLFVNTNLLSITFIDERDNKTMFLATGSRTIWQTVKTLIPCAEEEITRCLAQN